MFSLGKKKKGIDLDLPPPPPLEPDLIDNSKVNQELPKIKKSFFAKKPKEIDPVPSIDDFEKDLPPVPLPPDKEIKESNNETDALSELDEIHDDHIDFPNIKSEQKEIIPPPIQEQHDLPEIHEEVYQQNDIQLPEENLSFEQVTKEEKRKQIKGPIFVNVMSYKDSLSNISVIKSKIKDNERCIERLNEIKNQKDKCFEQFRSKLEDLQRKSLYVDKSLFEGVK
jgi:hypothetical protein